MNLELTEDERSVVRHALEVYLSDLREEIAKTEKHAWLQGLKREEQVLNQVIGRLA